MLEPGDVLYVPPGVAHWGVALGEAITYSLGFRALPPSETSWRDGLMLTLERISSQLAFLRMAPPLTRLHRDRGKSPPSTSPMPATRSTMRSMRWTTGRWFGEVVTEGR